MFVRAVCFPAMLLIVLVASPVLAGNCQNAATTIEMNACAARNYKAADRELNRTFERAVAGAQESDRNVQDADYSYEAALRTAQRAWIAFRDADCKQPPPPLSGSIATMDELDCLAQRTLQRTKELSQRLEQ